MRPKARWRFVSITFKVFILTVFLRQISRTPVGCMLGLNEIMLAYADGIVLVSPTWGVLQILLDKNSSFIRQAEIEM